MNIVFDTNVLISALVFGGNSGKTLDFCIENDEIYISEFITDELSGIMQKKFHLSHSDIVAVNELLASGFSLVKPDTRLPSLCRDKDDNNIFILQNMLMPISS